MKGGPFHLKMLCNRGRIWTSGGAFPYKTFADLYCGLLVNEFD